MKTLCIKILHPVCGLLNLPSHGGVQSLLIEFKASE